MTYLISACLLGCACRYDGQSKPISPLVKRLMEKATLIPVCPEILGGLSTPRPPAEIVGDRVINANGVDVSAAYRKGAEEALSLARLYNAQGIILRDKSPSCGKGRIYDGSFSRTLTDGNGVTAALFREAGIPIYSEGEIEELLSLL